MSKEKCAVCGDDPMWHPTYPVRKENVCAKCVLKALAFDTPANRAKVKAFDESRTEALREDAFDAKREQAREDVAAELDGDRMRQEQRDGERDNNGNRRKDGQI